MKPNVELHAAKIATPTPAQEGSAAAGSGGRARRRREIDRRRSGRGDSPGAPHAVDGEGEPRVFASSRAPTASRAISATPRRRCTRSAAAIVRACSSTARRRAWICSEARRARDAAAGRRAGAGRALQRRAAGDAAPAAGRAHRRAGGATSPKRAARQPRPDARLDARGDGARCARAAGDGAPPNELVQAALWLHGIVEPPPHLILAAMAARRRRRSCCDELAQRSCRRCSPRGAIARVGVGARGRSTMARRACWWRCRSRSSSSSRSRARSRPAAACSLRGRLHERLRAARGVRHHARRHGARSRARRRRPVRFGGTFRCGPQKGRYQIEVTGEDRFGATVRRQFPRLVRRRRADDGRRRRRRRASARKRRFSTAPAAEQTIWKLLNADRAQPACRALALGRAAADGGARAFGGHAGARLLRPHVADDRLGGGSRASAPASTPC